jgi:putative sporulation protein YyaC
MNLKPKFRSLMKLNESPELRIHYKEQTCFARLTKAIEQILLNQMDRPLVLVCIGTDRSTGDSLGPLIGTQLKSLDLPSLHIFGSLDEPVHAVNLNETYAKITSSFENPYIIAVDACLGRYTNVGMITVGEGPVLPGAGVNKDLPPIGEAHITGIVNVSGYMEYFVLQNTRLHVVMSMAQVISRSIHMAMENHKNMKIKTKIKFI